MRILIVGGTQFLGDEVLVVHRGLSEPVDWIPVRHLHTDRHELARHRDAVCEFDPQVVFDTSAMTAADVDAVLPVLPEVPTVVLSSQDVYQAPDCAPGAARSRCRWPRTRNCAASAAFAGSAADRQHPNDWQQGRA